jgi:ubiquinone/menaquinone biosynthesis C-methylase UbiE
VEDGEHRLIEWTGERCVPWTDDHQVVYEHLHRYLFATAVLEAAGGPRTALDLASGEGYGAATLARAGHRVTGVEIAPDAVAHARATYTDLPSLTFTEGSMLELDGFADSSVGAITCFEALEHVVEHDQLLAGISRVLADDGILFISSPDIDVYTHEQGQQNPFHVRELTRAELDDLLGKHFTHVRTWGQTVAAGSVMVDLAADGQPVVDGTGIVQAIRPDDPVAPTSWAQTDVPRATYLVAVASRSPLPSVPALGVLLDPTIAIVQAALHARNVALAGQA